MSKIKVGDRIRVYSNYEKWTGVVEKLYPNGRIDYYSESNGLIFGANIKQCRKLVKKQPREWWVNTNASAYTSIFNETDGRLVRTTKPDSTEGWICLREVKRK